MKNLKTLGLALALLLSTGAFKKDNPMLAIGAKAPMTNYEMEDISGSSYTLEGLKKDNGLLVIFSCNTCPFVLGWEDQYPGLKELSDKLSVGMVLVNSNEKKREGDDSMSEMQKHAKAAGYEMPYVIDANNKLADAFGARTTPHVYLFDSDMKLVYRGSINDKYENKSKEAKKEYLREALKALAKGGEIPQADTREIGCSIKRV